MTLDRRLVLPALFAAAALPNAASALLPRDPGETGSACAAEPLHADLRRAALSRLAEGVRAEDLAPLAHCPRCGCATLADLG